MSRRSLLLATIGVLGLLSAFVSSVATNWLAERWTSKLWLAVPLAVVLTAAVAVLAGRQDDKDKDKESTPPVGGSEQRNRARMLERVRSFWVHGVLEQSLHQMARVELGLETRPQAVPHPWELLVQPPDQAPRPLPSEIGITAVFDQLGQAVLILGAPGAGKTTLLLELARDLLDRADQDPAHPIPVVFNLASWAVRRQPLDQWLVEELHDRYDVPRAVGRTWVRNEQVLPLLDGLDEVARTHRAACVEAINTFRDQHGLLPLAVCSRAADYQELGTQLRLQDAILVQPLTREQVTAYLKEAGRPLAGVRTALRDDPQLWELLESPLLLGVVSLAYKGMPAAAVRAMGSAEERRRHLFAAYVARMLERRAGPTSSTPSQTQRWLAWLAGAMRSHDQSVFYLEQLQPDWLPSRRQRWLVTTGLALTLGVLVTIILFPLFSFASVVAGLVVGVLARGRTIRPVERMSWSRTGYRRRLFVRFGWGVLVGAAFGSVFVLAGTWTNEQGVPLARDFITILESMAGPGLFGGVIAGVIGGFLSPQISPRRTVPNEGIRRSGRRALLVGLLPLSVALFVSVVGVMSAGPPPGDASYNMLWYLTDTLFAVLIFLAMGMALWLPMVLWAGGRAWVQQVALRILLVRNRAIPWRYVGFLDESTDRLFLRKVGGGYVFVHRLLLEYFADLQKDGATDMTAHTSYVSP